MANIIEVDTVEIRYSQAILAVRDISFTVPEGGFVALVGANGAGKTTILRAISRLVELERGRVTRGMIRFGGRDVAGLAPSTLVADGIAQVLEGRRCFLPMTVEENLWTAAAALGLSRTTTRAALDRAYTRFPRLAERRHTPSALLSGGEQQMLAIERALVGQPKLLLLDEPTMGLAPQIAEAILETVNTLNREEGVTVLLAEQNVSLTLRYAQHAHVLENGSVRLSGAASDLIDHPEIWSSYLGLPTSAEPLLHAIPA
jgi:branched-chain amino acid transport system ATP-binding protein